MRDVLIALASEAAEVLQAVANSGVSLPSNWRWPLIDELSGAAALAAQCGEPSAPPAQPAIGIDANGGLTLDRQTMYASQEYKAQVAALERVVKLGIGKAPPSQPVALPDGWVAVPKRATQAMVDAAWSVDKRLSAFKYADAYAAMLAAAPAREVVGND